MDFGDMIELNIVRVTFRKPVIPENLNHFPSVKVIGILEKNSDKEFVCLIKKKIEGEFEPIM
jgi:hypothetical protein